MLKTKKYKHDHFLLLRPFHDLFADLKSDSNPDADRKWENAMCYTIR